MKGRLIKGRYFHEKKFVRKIFLQEFGLFCENFFRKISQTSSNRKNLPKIFSQLFVNNE
jgi:hypothetical protein